MRVFVTGATGLVGSNVVQVAAEKHDAEVIATIHRTSPIKPLPCITEPVDVVDRQAVFQSIRKYNPDVVVHSAALVDAEFLEKNHDIGWKIFVEWTGHINIKANPTLASDAADAFMAIYTRSQKGAFHCSGRECITRIELAKKVAKIFGFDEGLIGASFKDRADLGEWVGQGLLLPKETSLDTTGTEEKLGRKNLGVEEGLIQFKNEIQQDR